MRKARGASLELCHNAFIPMSHSPERPKRERVQIRRAPGMGSLATWAGDAAQTSTCPVDLHGSQRSFRADSLFDPRKMAQWPFPLVRPPSQDFCRLEARPCNYVLKKVRQVVKERI